MLLDWQKPASTNTTTRHFSPSHSSCTQYLTNSSGRYWYWRVLRLLLLWLISEASQMLLINGVVIYVMDMSSLDKQTATVIYHTTILLVQLWIYVAALCDMWSLKQHHLMPCLPLPVLQSLHYGSLWLPPSNST